MFLAFEFPGTRVIWSEEIYPAVVNTMRYSVVSFMVLDINLVSILIITWFTRAAILIYKHVKELNSTLDSVKNFHLLSHDKYAEAIFADIFGHSDVHIHRTDIVKSPTVLGFKPCILMPDFDFPPEELRPILKHEWKHYQDKDYLVSFITKIVCAVFWWNPLVYILKKNVEFALEVKCDYQATTTKEDVKGFFSAILRGSAFFERRREIVAGTNGLVSDLNGAVDRIRVVNLHVSSYYKQLLVNVCFTFVLSGLFVMSYMVLVKPAVWESPDVSESVECFTEDGVFRAGAIYVLDNGDGTFSLYINGQFAMNLLETSDSFEHITIHDSYQLHD
jgi:hypothetical protein